jgi:dihydrofolate reductase
MRKLIYFVACTADGFISRLDGTFDFFPMSGAHIPFIAEEFPETIPGHLRDTLGVTGGNTHFDTVVMGRNTYEVGTKVGVTNPYPHLRQYLVSRTLAARPHLQVHLVPDDPAALVRGLKQGDGLDIWLCGGAGLAGSLYGEIDELILKVNPVVLGTGLPLFRGVSGVTDLELVDHRVFDGGVAIHWYRRTM